MNTKNLTFVLMMGALGSALFAISYYAGPIAPGIALDFSLIAVIIAGVFAGPKIGFSVGIIAGILPGIMYGPMGLGGAAGLIALPLGKALTGFTSGLIAKTIQLEQKNRKSILGLPLSYLSYIPEALFTLGFFIFIMREIATGANFFLTIILPKALVEVTIIGIIIAALLGNIGFTKFIKSNFSKKQ